MISILTLNQYKKHIRHTYYNLIVMKKKLEADLISIAHRILQLKNKSDINQLYLESQKLYEKLSVLRFIDEHYGDVKPTIGHAEMEQEVQAFYDKDAELPAETVFELTETVATTRRKNGIEKPVVEESRTPADSSRRRLKFMKSSS